MQTLYLDFIQLPLRLLPLRLLPLGDLLQHIVVVLILAHHGEPTLWSLVHPAVIELETRTAAIDCHLGQLATRLGLVSLHRWRGRRVRHGGPRVGAVQGCRRQHFLCAGVGHVLAAARVGAGGLGQRNTKVVVDGRLQVVGAGWGC